MKQSKSKLRVASKFNVDQLNEQPLFATNTEAALSPTSRELALHFFA